MVKDSDPKKWNCPPHTRAKHQMLRRYLGGWFPILSSWNGRVVFLDGFAGRGRYNDGSEGSPLIALRCLVEHRYFAQMSAREREFVFFFVEADRENATCLEEEIDRFKVEHAPWPANVKHHVINAPFDETAQEILDHMYEQKTNLAPTFAFVDPFGYSGLPMDLLGDLLAYPGTEVFVNFMVGHVQRFITRDGQENAMRGLFGMDVADVLADFTGDRNRVEHLRAVYERQLKERASFEYVQSFAMINETGNVGYCLLHGTRHIRGVQVMKDAMWQVDPGGGNTFSDRLDGHDVLFTASPDLDPLRTAMLREFAGRRGVPIDDIERFALVHTPYRETHVRPVLKPLETSGAISVDRPGRTGFPAPNTRIDFL